MTDRQADGLERQYRFADNPIAHNLLMTYKSLVREYGTDEALAHIAEGNASLLEAERLRARIDEADKGYSLIKRLLERAHKWQLTEAGRTDMLTGELLMPQKDRITQLKGRL